MLTQTTLNILKKRYLAKVKAKKDITFGYLIINKDKLHKSHKSAIRLIKRYHKLKHKID